MLMLCWCCSGAVLVLCWCFAGVLCWCWCYKVRPPSLAAPAVVRGLGALCLPVRVCRRTHAGNRVPAKSRRRLLGRILTSCERASGPSASATPS
ncbi:hypothetical protein V8C37DRAFT_372925 [Trichoderma ceciliae]